MLGEDSLFHTVIYGRVLAVGVPIEHEGDGLTGIRCVWLGGVVGRRTRGQREKKYCADGGSSGDCVRSRHGFSIPFESCG